MQAHATLFGQITNCLYASEFLRSAERFPNRKPARGLTEYDHFLAMCFGQLTYRESLRDIVACLGSKPNLLYHLGFRGQITRTNLAYANKHRDWRLFQSIAEILMRRAATLYNGTTTGIDLPNQVLVLDSSIISLALNLFPWSYYPRTGKAALKLHVMLSLQGNLPAWALITQPSIGDMRMLDQIPVHPGAYYVMDRGYMDFVRLYQLHQKGGLFVVRCKEPVSFRVIERRIVDAATGFKCDQTVRLKSNWSEKSFPEPLRKIRLFDPENQVMLVLLTNNFSISAETIAQLYKRRWQVEIFFRWIKQNLRLRTFYGRSENAVRCQVWCAICAYLMVAILRKQQGIEKTMTEILQIISVSIFEQRPALEILAAKPASQQVIETESEQQNLFAINMI